MKYIRLFYAAFVCFYSGIYVSAQNAEDAAREINEIKLSDDYLYAELTMADEQEALEGARSILEMEVKDWLSAQGKEEEANTHIMQAKQHFSTINTMRRTYHRVFIYVQKEDIISLKMDDNTMVIHTDEPVSEPAVVLSESDVEATVYTPEEEQLVQIRLFSEVEPHIKKLQNSGKLEAYGKYKDMPTSAACILLVYDKNGDIVATLRRTAEGEFLNLKTTREDDIKNYKGCGAIWLQLK